MSSSADLDITIANAGVADVPALAMLSTACAVNNYAHIAAPDELAAYCEQYHSRRFFAERLADRHCAIRLALLPNGSPVGYMMLDPAELAVGDHIPEVELKRLFVLPRYRGRRLGERLFEHALADARDLHARLVVSCEPDDSARRRFYESLGFVFAGERAFNFGKARYHDLVFVLAGA